MAHMLQDQFLKKNGESDYNAACTVVTDLEHFRILINELLNKDTDIFPEAAPLIIWDIKSDVCMAKNGKDTKNTMHIDKILHFSRNGKNYKMHKIEWCEGGLDLADISTKNVVENYLNPRMKYIMISIDK